jgi:SAM-dependent methyltransferase
MVPIAFLQFDVESGPLPVKDKEIDVTFVNNVTYHVNDPESLLNQAIQVTKAGGKVVTNSRGDFNHVRLWEKAKLIAKFISEQPGHPKITAPTPFYSHFDIETTHAYMEQRPDVRLVESIPQIGPMRIPSSDHSRDDLVLAHFSLGDSFEPKPPNVGTHWQAIEAVVGQEFDKETERIGGYYDFVEQQADIWEVLA